MFANQNFDNAAPIAFDSFQESAWSSARVVPSLDVETAAMLRMHMHEDFSNALSWQDLSERLNNKGFYLKTDGTTVRIHDTHSHVEICTCSFLGFPSAQLEARFNETRH